ncbi:putative RNA binding [Giardia duodenalis]|uniref:RNA binding n=1 Tax=Giardia intestinalis (strain ATCC 50803 / WB clone C6) TaxID=184922 RepID=A8B3D2_GIAIC|nr:putative RNA binding [Giardia intestinalis]KAE8303146.1 putative RNA binding [Giardia intestinalis]|eukprot:XP_001710187.1 RNA binding putative [Giardia lamblia ATCC 50803]
MSGRKGDEGVIYVGHLPHCFMERPMRCFFSQFGKVLQVRVSRNKEQKSRGYGYVKFASRAVAKIAAETMNNYLMFNKILKVSYLETWNDNLFWHGCEYERQPTPHRAIYREEYNAPKNEEKWEAEMETVKSARLRTLGKLKDLGYEYEMPPLFYHAPMDGNEAENAENAEGNETESKQPYLCPSVITY